MKTKSRNLLTVILAMLCAAAVALGIGFLLPKAEKINAHAATSTPIVRLGAANTTGSIAVNSGDNCYITNTVSAPYIFDSAQNSTVNYSLILQFSIELSVPKYTQYTVKYPLVMAAGLNSGAVLSAGTCSLERYDSTYSTVQEQLIPPTTQWQCASANGNNFDYKFPSVNNLIFTNDTGGLQIFTVYFSMQINVITKSGGSAAIQGCVGLLNSYSIEATKLAVPAPAVGDTLTLPYDGNPHTVNFTYAKSVTLTDLDGNVHQYTNGYQNVAVTIEAVDGDGNTTNTYTTTPANISTATGSGSITATDSGTYTLKFDLTPSAISNGLEWVGGGTDQKTIELKINRLDPTVNPVVGSGTWYVSNSLYSDISIATSAGDTPGTISWDADQTLSAGTNNYGWTFKPTDTRNYNDKTGAESITAANVTITGIQAAFTQGTAKFYTSSKLNDLKVKLAVDKVYNNGSTVRLADADYTLTGNISTAGTATITVTYTSKNTEDPALEEFTDTFNVVITAVAITSISATFNPTGNIYLSDTLNDLKDYLTVDATYNDGSVKNNITDYTITSPSALSLGTVTVTVTSDEDNTVTDTFTVNVLPDPVIIELKIPKVSDITYTGEEFDVLDELTNLTSAQITKYLDVTGTTTGRTVGEYTVKFKIKSEHVGSVEWEKQTTAAVKYSLSSKVVADAQVSADGRTVTLKWNIIKAKVAAVWDSEKCIWVPAQSLLAETTESNFLVQTYTNSSGKSFTSRSKLAGGRTYQVTAKINSAYAKNIELDDATLDLMNSGDETYTYTPPYVPTIWDKILAFLKANWLWLVIAAAALILLIIIIVVAKKCHKSKEEREEIKARKEEERRRKEEERQRREEERRLQQERLQAERDLAKAKQEAELEKIRAQAQAGMAGAGMATMAMAQPQQQAMPTQVPVQTVDNDFLKEMTRQMAELRADNKATQEKLAAMQNNQTMPAPMMPMQHAMPMQYQQYSAYPQYGDPTLARLEAQINAMQIEQRARYDAEQRIELAAMRAEQHVDRDSRHSVDLAAMREHYSGNMGYNRIPDYSNQQSNNIDALGAIVAAALKNIAGGEAAATQVPELPQKSEQEPVAKYPSDAVITTTTTVDTTKNKPVRREEEADFDIDGFYDPLD